MFGAQATLLLALAVATAAVLRRSPSSADPATSTGARGRGPSCVDPETLRAFLLVGSGALVVLALAVVAVGVFDRADRAAGLAVISLFGYLAYLGLAVLGCHRVARRS